MRNIHVNFFFFWTYSFIREEYTEMWSYLNVYMLDM